MAVTSMDPGLRESWRRAALVSLAVLVLAGATVALVRSGAVDRTDGDDSASVTRDASAAGESATTAGADALDAAPADRDEAQGGGGSSVAVGGPRIIKTAALQVEVRGEVAATVERAEGIAAAAGGFVASSSSTTFEEGRSRAELSLRVPAERFDDVRRRVQDLGTVRSSETGGQDVGGQLVDLAARLRTLRSEEGALDTLLGRAAGIGEILQVRDRLTAVRTEIERLAGQEASLEDRVGYATIDVSFHQAGAAALAEEGDDRDTGLVASLRSAVNATEAVVGGMVIVLGAALPFLVLAALAWPVVRVVRRRMAVS